MRSADIWGNTIFHQQSALQIFPSFHTNTTLLFSSFLFFQLVLSTSILRKIFYGVPIHSGSIKTYKLGLCNLNIKNRVCFNIITFLFYTIYLLILKIISYFFKNKICVYKFQIYTIVFILHPFQYLHWSSCQFFFFNWILLMSVTTPCTAELSFDGFRLLYLHRFYLTICKHLRRAHYNWPFKQTLGTWKMEKKVAAGRDN